ncbi:MAG: hypothetical protein IPN86_16020 [Saprospiraceae bacterium]|nr:hypothetical protein [Saprospiraceae bacterium]
MKSKWLILTTPEDFSNVSAMVSKRKIEILNHLENIFVIEINTTKKKAENLKNVQGVLSVEEEGYLSIQ